MANTGGLENATLDTLVAHGKAFFAAVSTNPNYPDARKKFARDLAVYIRDETKKVSDSRIFKTRTDQNLYKDSRLGYGMAADALLDDSGNTDLENLIGTDATENMEFGRYVCSSYDAMVSMLRKLIEMEAVSEVAGEALDAGYLQTAYHYLDGAAHALIGSAHRAWSDDADDRRALYAEMDADFPGKVSDYRKTIGERTRTMDVLHAACGELCAGGKDSKKIAKGELDDLIERKKSEMMPKSVVKDASRVGYA